MGECDKACVSVESGAQRHTHQYFCLEPSLYERFFGAWWRTDERDPPPRTGRHNKGRKNLRPASSSSYLRGLGEPKPNPITLTNTICAKFI